MFCKKCGQPHDDDALFCEFCGTRFNAPTAGGQAAPVQTPVQAPPPAPVYAPAPALVYAPAPKKRSKAGVIAAIISAAAVIMAVSVFAVFFLNREKLTMTVNGNNVPVALTEFIHYTDQDFAGDAAYGAAFAGKTDDEVFMLEMRLPKELKSNTTINGSDNNDLHMFLSVTGKVWGINEYTGNYNDPDSKITEYTLEIGQFAPDEYIEITVSAKTEINGRTYNIKADGKLNFDRYDEILYKTVDWFKENRHSG